MPGRTRRWVLASAAARLVRRRHTKALLALMGAVNRCCVACTNVASLLWRATARRQDLAIRVALGGRLRIVGNCSPSMVLALAGAGLASPSRGPRMAATLRTGRRASPGTGLAGWCRAGMCRGAAIVTALAFGSRRRGRASSRRLARCRCPQATGKAGLRRLDRRGGGAFDGIARRAGLLVRSFITCVR
jgi:hypothetical protein